MLGRLAREPCDLRQLLGGRVLVDRGVGDEEHPVLEEEQVRSGSFFDALAGLVDLQRRADRLGVGHGETGDEPVGVTAG